MKPGIIKALPRKELERAYNRCYDQLKRAREAQELCKVMEDALGCSHTYAGLRRAFFSLLGNREEGYLDGDENQRDLFENL